MYALSDFAPLNACSIHQENSVFHLTANPNTDFICKYESYRKDNASFFYVEQEGDFTLTARITVDGSAPFDALFLMARESPTRWIKLALELGVDQQYNAVSVITDDWSDDANGELVVSNSAWLRITRKENFWGLHYSLTGEDWRFVRAFGLALAPKLSVGFGIQAPQSDSCSGEVIDFLIVSTPVENFRNGS